MTDPSRGRSTEGIDICENGQGRSWVKMTETCKIDDRSELEASESKAVEWFA